MTEPDAAGVGPAVTSGVMEGSGEGEGSGVGVAWDWPWDCPWEGREVLAFSFAHAARRSKERQEGRTIQCAIPGK